jgi:ABC-type glycerol-3-phosphate transport system substrate-binding protein
MALGQGEESSETEVQGDSEMGIGVIEDGAELTILGGAHLISITEAVLKDFMAEHPEIKLNFAKFSYAEYPVKMRIQLSEGAGTPDIILCHDLFITQFVDAGFLLDLSGITDFENTLPVLTPVTKDGKCYGLPNQVSNQYIFLYRKDIYDKLGLEPPKTYDEYFEQALILKDNGYYAGAFNPADKKCHFMFTQYVVMLGGSVLDENGEISLNKGVEALNLIKKSYDSGIWHTSVMGDSEEYWAAYNDGQIAAFPNMASQAAYYETRVDPEGAGGYGFLAVAPIMQFSPDGPKTVINNTEYFAINKNTMYPNAAKLLVSYLCQSTEASLKFSNVNEEGLMAKYANGYIPGLNAVAQSGNGWKAFGGTDVVAYLSQNLIEAKPEVPYVDERSPEIQKIISDIIGEMFLENKYTPEEAVKEMRNRISRL